MKVLIKVIRELVEKISAKRYKETFKGKMFRLYCKKIVTNQRYDTIEAYEEILAEIVKKIGCKTKKEAALAYLYSVRYIA